MIVFTPLDMPNAYPDNWEIFWNIWNQHKRPLVKTEMYLGDSIIPIGDDTYWDALDIYKQDFGKLIYDAPYYDMRNELPNFMKTLLSNNIPSLFRIRLMSNKRLIHAHSDTEKDRFMIRGLLFTPTSEPYWYLTAPNKTTINKKYITLPESTYWFAYNDKFCFHGSEYYQNCEKILIQLFLTEDESRDIVQQSIIKYKEYVIDDQEL